MQARSVETGLRIYRQISRSTPAQKPARSIEARESIYRPDIVKHACAYTGHISRSELALIQARSLERRLRICRPERLKQALRVSRPEL